MELSLLILYLAKYLINLDIQQQQPSLSFPEMHLKITVLILEKNHEYVVNNNPFHGNDWENDKF